MLYLPYGPTLTSITTGKTTALTIWTFGGKMMSLIFNKLSRLVIAFLLSSKHLLISRLQSPSAVILEPKKMKSDTVSTLSPSICHEVIGQDAMTFAFWMFNRFSRLYPVDRVPEELQRFVTLCKRWWPKPSPRKTNARRQSGCLRRPYKLLRKKREANDKGERERHTQLNAEFQGTARRDEKAFLSE